MNNYRYNFETCTEYWTSDTTLGMNVFPSEKCI